MTPLSQTALGALAELRKRWGGTDEEVIERALALAVSRQRAGKTITRAMLEDARDNGFSIAQLAREIGVGTATVRAAIKRHGVGPNASLAKGINWDAELDVVCARGENARQAARRLSVSPQVVGQAAKLRGISLVRKD